MAGCTKTTFERNKVRISASELETSGAELGMSPVDPVPSNCTKDEVMAFYEELIDYQQRPEEEIEDHSALQTTQWHDEVAPSSSIAYGVFVDGILQRRCFLIHNPPWMNSHHHLATLEKIDFTAAGTHTTRMICWR